MVNNMNYFRRRKFDYILIVISFLLCFSIVHSENLIKHVFGSGAVVSSSSNYSLKGTLGQPIIGEANNSNDLGQFGFWYSLSAPIAICKDLTIELDITGNASITGEQINNGSQSECGIKSLSVMPNTFTCSDVGENSVTLIVLDNCNNSSTCTAIVTVIDNRPPNVITKFATVTLSNGGASITANDVNDGSNDACGIKSLDVSPNIFDCSDLGDNNVTLTVTDNNNNSATGIAIVTVIGSIPTPSITVNPEYPVNPGGEKNTIYLGYGAQSVVLTATGGVSYSWSSNPSGFTSSQSNPEVSARVTTTYTVQVTNTSGCVATKSVTIYVKDVQGPNKKVYICHKPDRNTLCVSENAVPAHLAHGDYLGPCREDAKSGESDDIDEQMQNYQGDEFTVKLKQNSPNPFSYMTEIQYFVSQREHVSLILTDITGRVVANLIDSYVPPSWNTLIINGSGLTPGVYIVRIESQGKADMMKIIKAE